MHYTSQGPLPNKRSPRTSTGASWSVKMILPMSALLVAVGMWRVPLEIPSHEKETSLQFLLDLPSPPSIRSRYRNETLAVHTTAAEVCESTAPLFSNISEILAAIDIAEKFHNRGGSLKSIQEYLDAQIDETHDKLGVKYYPADAHDDGEGKVWGSELIISEMRKRDTSSRGGYDQRQLPGKLSPKHPAVTDGRFVDVMEPNAFKRWEAALGPIGPRCKSVNRIQFARRPSYQDKFMCSYDVLQEVKKVGQTSHESKCNMFSIGSNDQWGFEGAVIQQTYCHTYTFDCTIANPRRKPASEKVAFHSVCISGEDKVVDGRQYLSYKSMHKLSGIKGPPKLLKMDVEGFEYDVLSSLFESSKDEELDILPEQIVVELHFASRMFDLPWMLRFRQAAEITLLIGTMYRGGGYLPVHFDFNEGCPSCLEVIFARVLCSSTNRSPAR